ncbi:MAG: MotA/TolQ/ExbB proton channel family protein [bacterium]|nr:MotA/TolQ/ExbB proton channel family protein [bacterium]
MKVMTVLIIFIIILHVGFSSIMVFSQDEEPASQVNVPSSTDTLAAGQSGLDTGKRGFSVETMLELLKLCEGIGYLLIMVFVLGVLFIFQKWFVLLREKQDTEKIPVAKMKTMSYDDIQKMFTHVKDANPDSDDDDQSENKNIPLLKRIFRRKKASAFQLLSKLYKVFESQKSTSSFVEETSSYIQHLKDGFNPFFTRLSFFSDTAGALGLLGTVWGMFLVFYKGSPDPEDTLRGMGIALATTIVGLVISIILNSFTTVISNIFDKHLDFIKNMSTAFQERLMKEEEKYPIKAQPIIVESSAIAARPQQIPEMSKREEKAKHKPIQEASKEPAQQQILKGNPAEIRIKKGDNQSGEVGTKLSDPIVVEVLDSKGNALENETVVFSSDEGSGVFSNNSRVQKILTDEEGIAQTNFTLGRTSGEKTIHVAVEDSNNRGIKLLAIAKPTPPTKLIELKGNYQTGELGKRLPLPFIVAVRDKYDNPIQRYEINFSLKKGTGRFQDSQNAHYATYTNEDGLVEVYFIIGNNRGGREIEAEAKKVEPSKILFEAFAQ